MADQQRAGIILLENIHNKFSNISGLNTLLGGYEVAFVTFAIYLVLSIKSMLNLFLLGDTKIHYFQIFILWYLIFWQDFTHIKDHWFICLIVPFITSILWRTWRKSIDFIKVTSKAMVRNLRVNPFCFQIFWKLAHVKKKICMMKEYFWEWKKRNLVSQCLEVWTSSKDKAFKFWAQINHYFKTGYFLHYILDLETQTNHQVQFYKICP